MMLAWRVQPRRSQRTASWDDTLSPASETIQVNLKMESSEREGFNGRRRRQRKDPSAITETPLYGVGNSNQGRVCILIPPPPFTEYQVYLDSSRDVRQTTEYSTSLNKEERWMRERQPLDLRIRRAMNESKYACAVLYFA